MQSLVFLTYFFRSYRRKTFGKGRINTTDQYFISSKHSNKALVEDGGFTQNNNRISTGDSIDTNFGKRVEHTL